MPIQLPPISRRRFLQATAATAAAALLPGLANSASPPVDPNRFALLADTHINAIKQFTHHSNIRMYAQLMAVSDEVIALDPRPAAVLINGDCAHLLGTPGDYEALVEVLTPMRETGLTIHLALGNHDHRENFWLALAPDEPPRPQVADRHVLCWRASTSTGSFSTRWSRRT